MEQSTYTEKQLINFTLEGNHLKPKNARELEEVLELNPGDIPTRTQLLGYYFTRHHFRKAKRMRWRAHILWMVENLADHPFHLTAFTRILEGDDPDGHKLYKALWLKHTAAQPKSAEIFANAAVALHFDNPKEGRQLVLRAQELNSQLEAVKRAVSLLDGLQEYRRSRQIEI